MKVLIIHAHDEAELGEAPDKDIARLDWFQSTVGGYIEGIGPRVNRLPDTWFAYCDEEGKLKGKPVNAVATRLALLAGWPPGDVLCGTVVFCGRNQVDETDVPESLIELGRTHNLWVEDRPARLACMDCSWVSTSADYVAEAAEHRKEHEKK